MKKLLLILLAITMCVSMCACGSDNDSIDGTTSIDDGSIELTLENYKQFLKTDVDATWGGDIYPGVELQNGRFFERTHYDSVAYTMNVEATSTNFNYIDVCVTAKITIKSGTILPSTTLRYGRFSANPEIEVTTDIAGNGTATDSKKVGKTSNGDILCVDAYTIEYDYEIISVKGKVIPVR